MAENSNWSYIPNLQDEYGGSLMLKPMEESIEVRHLVWEVPDNEHNRTHLKRFYHNFIMLEDLSKEKKIDKKVTTTKVVVEKKEEVVEEIQEELVVDESYTPTNPKEMQQLKAKIMAELDDAGIPYSKTSSLKILRELKKNA